MSTAFQPNAFQSTAFQEHGGLTTSDIVINIGGIQDGDTGLITINVVSAEATGGWPTYYPRRKKVPRGEPDTATRESPEEVTARLVAAQQAIQVRRELRKAEQRSQDITAQLREIYAEQDALALSVEHLETVIQQQLQDDDDLALVLALAS